MARPREFDERTVLDAAVRAFWRQGFEATSMRDLIAETGLTGASLYNAFGDKRRLYERALEHYVDASVVDRIDRCAAMPPRAALVAFFDDILERSLTDPECRGCMLVNAALGLAPQDPEFREVIAAVLRRIERFFLETARRGQAEGTIAAGRPAEEIAQHLLGVLMGLRVLARVRPERALLEGTVRPALAML